MSMDQDLYLKSIVFVVICMLILLYLQSELGKDKEIHSEIPITQAPMRICIVVIIVNKIDVVSGNHSDCADLAIA